MKLNLYLTLPFSFGGRLLHLQILNSTFEIYAMLLIVSVVLRMCYFIYLMRPVLRVKVKALTFISY